MRVPLPPKETVDSAWDQLSQTGPLGAVLVIVLAMLIVMVAFLAGLYVRKDRENTRGHDQYVLLAMEYSSTMVKYAERFQRMLGMLDLLVQKAAQNPGDSHADLPQP